MADILKKRNARIRSHGIYVPERVVGNEYFDELLGENVSEWLEKNVEIYERRWCADNESVADLCVQAAKKALHNGNMQASEIDLLIIATDTPEFISPSTASKVQHILSMDNAATFDINTACAGFVTAFDTAAKFIQADTQYRNIMIIGAYAMSKYLCLTDKKTSNLFADGAGAMILEAEENSSNGLLASKMITKGHYYDFMGIYAGGTYRPLTHDLPADNSQMLQLTKKFPKELNPQMWSSIALDLCKKINIKPEEVDQYLLTQINIMSIRETMDILGLPHSKAHTSMHYYGYTGSACIPLAFDDAVKKNKIKRGDLIFMIGSGGGLAFAGAAIKY